MSLILAIAGALLPILFVVGLGWLAARTNVMPGSAAGRFAAFVVTFALPLPLSLAAADAKPSDLSEFACILALAAGLIGTFAACIVPGRLVFHSQAFVRRDSQTFADLGIIHLAGPRLALSAGAGPASASPRRPSACS